MVVLVTTPVPESPLICLWFCITFSYVKEKNLKLSLLLPVEEPANKWANLSNWLSRENNGNVYAPKAVNSPTERIGKTEKNSLSSCNNKMSEPNK